MPLPGRLGRLRHTREYVIAKNAVKRLAPNRFKGPLPIDDSGDSALLSLPARRMDWPEGVPRPSVGLVMDTDDPPYWTKYRRFLEANRIPYLLYDIHRSDWRHRAADLDVVLWRPMSVPSELDECRRKIWLLESVLGVTCYPSLAEALIYEDKLLQYELLDEFGLPVVPTFVSHSETEALAFAASLTYPAVWKVACGASSLGVELIRDRRAAERRIRRAFSFAGRRTIWPYAPQKDYVYLQHFQPNAGYDLRVMVIGDAVLGYHRAVPPGDFRASGMDTTYHRAIPQGAMLLARRVRDALRVTALGLDMLADPEERRFAIIEISLFTQIKDAFRLEIDGVSGSYRYEEGAYRFVPGPVLPHDLVLEELLTTRWIRRLENAPTPEPRSLAGRS
jgi:glutathione synthase/RimK-type ligase-like ATP-grasp enzyme